MPVVRACNKCENALSDTSTINLATINKSIITRSTEGVFCKASANVWQRARRQRNKYVYFWLARLPTPFQACMLTSNSPTKCNN